MPLSPGSRSSFASALLLLIVCTATSVQTSPSRAAAGQYATAAAPDAMVAASADQGPPAGHWLKDGLGREYFVARTPKNRAARIDRNTVRDFWGFPLDVVREEGSFYYYKVYRPVAAPKPAPVARISPQQGRRIRDSSGSTCRSARACASRFLAAVFRRQGSGATASRSLT